MCPLLEVGGVRFWYTWSLAQARIDHCVSAPSSNPVDPTSCILMSCQFACIFVSGGWNEVLPQKTWTRIDRFFYAFSFGGIAFCCKRLVFEKFATKQAFSQPERRILRSENFRNVSSSLLGQLRLCTSSNCACYIPFLSVEVGQ